MSYLPLAAALVLGISLGLHFSRLLAAIIRDLGGSEASVKHYREIFIFCLTGVIGTSAFAYIAGKEPAFGYLLGYGVGNCFGFFFPCLPTPLTRSTVRTVLALNESIRDDVPDEDNRVLLILNTLEPPKIIQRNEGWTAAEFASRLENAADAASHKP